MAWTATGGGDHEGANWTPADSLTIAGVHYNIGIFLVTAGYTVNIDTGTALEIFANTITINGTIDGDADGFVGGAGSTNSGGNSYSVAGSGPGGAPQARFLVAGSQRSSGGGAGYYGTGGRGGYNPADDSPYGIGGVSNGSVSDVEYSKGSGGAGGCTIVDDTGSTYGGQGGRGGAGIALYANTITVGAAGIITCVGEDGEDVSGFHTAGGAGSGGGILLVGGTITTPGTLAVDGGVGGDSASYEGGGGGSCGRIKIIGYSINTTGLTATLTGGAAGSGGTGQTAGASGSLQSVALSQCTSSLPLGQTFTLGHDGATLLSKVNLWVNTVNTAGDFILKVWDSTSKNTEYATKTVTINGMGWWGFEFAAWARIPDGESTYYLELTTAGAGDVIFATYGISTLAGGDYYRNLKVVSRFDMYHQIYSIGHVKGPSVYNMADTSVKSNVANTMLIGAIYTINADNTGAVQYTDDFTTAKYLGDYAGESNTTHDTGDDELDIADDGYLYYLIDTKYPVTGIPTLTAQINITSGTPTIQISSNGSDWYDIDTAIVDDVDTEYELDNAVSLSLKGITTFYIRFDCGGTGTVTCSIKSFEFDAVIVLIDVEKPVINTGAANTIRCDQDSDSSINCGVSLVYRDRKWPA